MRLAGEKVLVVGLGASGAAAARLCLEAGARVRVTDAAPHPPAAEELAALGCDLSLGGHRAEDFTWAGLVVLSPGVDQRMAEVRAAAAAGAEVIGELELGWRFLRRPAVMITGTNGKSTVTTLVGRMLQEAGLRAFVGGNLGQPLCAVAGGGQDFDWAVLEVSSFQLDTAVSLSPAVAVVLNIAPDHLDRYHDFAAYADSKMSLPAGQDPAGTAVLCWDDPEITARAAGLPGRVLPYSDQWESPSEAPGPLAGLVLGRELVLYQDGRPVLELSTEASKLPGAFNRGNVLAAGLAAWAVGVDQESMQRAIDGFTGLGHRLQWVANIGGVDYFDDSKGTNLGAVMAAVRALERPTVVLLGGRDKQGRFDQLLDLPRDLLARAICFGEAGPAIAGQLAPLGPRVALVPDLAEAVRLAAAQARPGQAVLLSPGCASFDAYGSYAERGDHFQTLVKEAARG